jgi:hypothetical protein
MVAVARTARSKKQRQVVHPQVLDGLWSNGQTEGQIIGSAILHLLEHNCHDAEVTHGFTLA